MSFLNVSSNRPIRMILNTPAVLVSAFVLAAASAFSSPLDKVAKVARAWLDASEDERAALELVLKNYNGDIDAVMAAITPKGRAEHAAIKGKEVKADTFTVTNLLARNQDYLLNFYVPPTTILPGRWGSSCGCTAAVPRRPVPVDHLIKEGVIKTAKTMHVDTYSLWLHPKMGVDFSRPIEVTTNGVTAKFTCQPSLLTALQSFERKEDWGLVYSASVLMDAVH